MGKKILYIVDVLIWFPPSLPLYIIIPPLITIHPSGHPSATNHQTTYTNFCSLCIFSIVLYSN